MLRPLVIAYHLIWTGYGHWLPNDPRGSGSNIVLSERIAALGELHFGRKRVQPPSQVVREFYRQAEPILYYPLLTFDQTDIETIGAAFAEIIAERNYTCYACAIMPDHVHILIRKHRDLAEEMIENLQDCARAHFRATGKCDAGHPIWTQAAGGDSCPCRVKYAVSFNTSRRIRSRSAGRGSSGVSSRIMMVGHCIPGTIRIRPGRGGCVVVRC